LACATAAAGMGMFDELLTEGICGRNARVGAWVID
jgi:hypothetical protein